MEDSMDFKTATGSSVFATGHYAEKPVPLEKLLARLRELDFDGIELFGGAPYGSMFQFPTQQDRQKLRELILSYDLDIAFYGSQLCRFPPASAEQEIRSNYCKLFAESVQFCVDCGIMAMRVDSVSPPPGPNGIQHEKAVENLVTVWRECTKLAEAQEVTILWEFEPGFMVNRPYEILSVLEQVDTVNFKVLFDSCHAHMCSVVAARQDGEREMLGGGELEFARLLGTRIGYVHLVDSDNTLDSNGTSAHIPFGDGELNFDALVSTIMETGYRGPWWAIDLCNRPDAWELLSPSKQYLDDLLDRHGLRINAGN
jgi:sugar phosphate isomerase/epimerase